MGDARSFPSCNVLFKAATEMSPPFFIVIRKAKNSGKTLSLYKSYREYQIDKLIKK